MVEGKNRWKAWIYLAPAIALLLVFTVYPIINTIVISFLDGYSSLGAFTTSYGFGIGNYIMVLKYKDFKTCLWNTFVLSMTVPISTILALLIAVALNSIKPFQRILQTIFFLPYVTNTIAIGMVFAIMFNLIKGSGDDGIIISAGIINNIIGVFGIDPVDWIGVSSGYWQNITVVVVYIIWNALPFKIIILLGGLQSVNKQLYDAAKIDGASRIKTFYKITIPMLSPMLAYVIITGFIGAFKEYNSVVGIFGELMGPINNELNTMVGFIYEAMRQEHTGRAAAAALILFVIIFFFTMINLYISKKKVHY